MKRSEFKIGEFLVTTLGNCFIHDGYTNGDGYGCVIGENGTGVVERSTGSGNWQKYPIDHVATDEERERLIRKIRNQREIEFY